jgi:3-hydroxyisobutyrate dehydrogenase-like beta-hydroxyacid dehydrogenase
MGAAIARNLLRAGHEMSVFNRSRDKAEPFASEGARVANSVADVCRGSEVVFTMLADDSAAAGVTLGKDAFGENGIVAALDPGAMHVSISTISTGLARQFAAAHVARGQGYLSAPVFGRPEAAESRKLIVVPAGAPELVALAQPLFDAIGRATFIAGTEPWQANALKLCGNFMIVSVIEAFGEAFATLRKAGVDPQLFLSTMVELFQSPVYKGYGQAIADGKFEPAGFALRLGLKDVRLALQTADECASPMPLASLIRDRMLDALAHGQGEQDWSSLATVSARNAGM